MFFGPGIGPNHGWARYAAIKSNRIVGTIKILIQNHAEFWYPQVWVSIFRIKAGGKPSTWLPPGGLVERLQITTNNKNTNRNGTGISIQCHQQMRLPNTIANHMADTNPPTNHHLRTRHARKPSTTLPKTDKRCAPHAQTRQNLRPKIIPPKKNNTT